MLLIKNLYEKDSKIELCFNERYVGMRIVKFEKSDYISV